MCYLATSLEFLATNKHELIPLCKRRAEEFQREMNFPAKKVKLFFNLKKHNCFGNHFSFIGILAEMLPKTKIVARL
jgi:hypothetical protein